METKINPRPLMVDSFVDWIGPRLHPDMSVFEFGSGGSTLWFSGRVWRLVTVEHDAGYLFNHIPWNVIQLYRPIRISNGCMNHEDIAKYCDSCRETGTQYDILIIDGMQRVDCYNASIHCLTDRGVVILDDAQMEGNGVIIAEGLRGEGFECLEFRDGLKVTAVFYKSGNCLGI